MKYELPTHIGGHHICIGHADTCQNTYGTLPVTCPLKFNIFMVRHAGCTPEIMGESRTAGTHKATRGHCRVVL